MVAQMSADNSTEFFPLFVGMQCNVDEVLVLLLKLFAEVPTAKKI